MTQPAATSEYVAGWKAGYAAGKADASAEALVLVADVYRAFREPQKASVIPDLRE